jgi:hypothetical protein
VNTDAEVQNEDFVPSEGEWIHISPHSDQLEIATKKMVFQLKDSNGRCSSAERTLAMRHLQEAGFWLREDMELNG